MWWGEKFSGDGASKEGTRGEKHHVVSRFASLKVGSLKIVTEGCHGLTFPSVSRLSEVGAFSKEGINFADCPLNFPEIRSKLSP